MAMPMTCGSARFASNSTPAATSRDSGSAMAPSAAPFAATFAVPFAATIAETFAATFAAPFAASPGAVATPAATLRCASGSRPMSCT